MSSLLFCILLIIHHFVVLDETTAKSLLSLAGQKTSDTAVHNILNSDRYTGVMYILAYLAGVVALWNRHPYLWWFMFAVYVSNALFTLVNLYMFVQAIWMLKCCRSFTYTHCCNWLYYFSDLYVSCFDS